MNGYYRQNDTFADKFITHYRQIRYFINRTRRTLHSNNNESIIEWDAIQRYTCNWSIQRYKRYQWPSGEARQLDLAHGFHQVIDLGLIYSHDRGLRVNLMTNILK